MRVSQLWNWHGAMGRRDYFIWGTLLLALKFNLDRFLLDVGPDGRILNVTDYFHAGFPGSQWLTLEKLRDSGFLKKDERVVLFNTGAAWKYSEVLDPGNPAVLDPADPNVLTRIEG